MKTIKNWYLSEVTNKNLQLDKLQLEITHKFDEFITNTSKQNYITRLFNPIDKLGFYIYGDVGRGKTMLTNQLFKHLHTEKKLRIHFHQFMLKIQELQNSQKHTKDSNPLDSVAKAIKKKYKYILLDEFHISDIGTAMVIKNILEALFNHNVHIITSSNFAPNDLYKDGLMYERFLPCVNTIKEKLSIINLNNTIDYRSGTKEINILFVINQVNSQEQLNKIWKMFSQNETVENSILDVNDRKINYQHKTESSIWFDFEDICGGLQSNIDYIELSHRYKKFIISNITPLNEEDKDKARRFTWLIDVLYDEHKIVAIESKSAIKNIYIKGDFCNEFQRTISRLNEISSNKYLKDNKFY